MKEPENRQKLTVSARTFLWRCGAAATIRIDESNTRGEDILSIDFACLLRAARKPHHQSCSMRGVWCRFSKPLKHWESGLHGSFRTCQLRFDQDAVSSSISPCEAARSLAWLYAQHVPEAANLFLVGLLQARSWTFPCLRIPAERPSSAVFALDLQLKPKNHRPSR